MYRKIFVCLCRRTESLMCNIFNAVFAISDMNNIYKFQDIQEYTRRLQRAQLATQIDKANAYLPILRILYGDS